MAVIHKKKERAVKRIENQEEGYAQMSVRLPASIAEALEKHASDNKKSKGLVVYEALKMFLNV